MREIVVLNNFLEKNVLVMNNNVSPNFSTFDINRKLKAKKTEKRG